MTLGSPGLCASIHPLLWFFTRRGAVLHGAEELANDAFMTLWWARESVKEGKEFAYLVGITRNTLSNYWRVKNRREKWETSFDDLEEGDGDIAGDNIPGVGVMQEESSQAIVAALECSSGRQRECLVLRYFHGMSAAETAREMGITRAGVVALEKRALIALRKRLRDL